MYSFPDGFSRVRHQYVSKKVFKGSSSSTVFGRLNNTQRRKTSWDFPDEHLGAITVEPVPWIMHFDGAMNQYETGLGVILVTPEKELIPCPRS